MSPEQLRRLIQEPETLAGASQQLLVALESAMHLMFQAMFLITILIMIVAWLVPDLSFGRVVKPAE